MESVTIVIIITSYFNYQSLNSPQTGATGLEGVVQHKKHLWAFCEVILAF